MRSVLRALKSLFESAPAGEPVQPRSTAPLPSPNHNESRVSVVALLVEEQDRKLLNGICRGYNWIVHFAETFDGLAEAAVKLEAAIVLCDRDLPETDWRDALRVLAASPHRPCVILVSRVLDEYLRIEVSRSNGHDAMAKPLRQEEVVRAIKLAWTYWKQRNHAEPAGKWSGA